MVTSSSPETQILPFWESLRRCVTKPTQRERMMRDDESDVAEFVHEVGGLRRRTI